MYIKVLGCNVLRRELYLAAACSRNKVDLEFLVKGLHDMGAPLMQARMQEAIDAIGDDYDAIALGYGLCNNGLMNVEARRRPLVIPRAHDCITMFLGSRHRYRTEFDNEPGTYFKTSGWIERTESPDDINQLSIQRQTGMDKSYEELVAKYGEENAAFLYETLIDNTRNYKRYAYIAMGIGPDDKWEEETRVEADRRGWQFEKLTGDMRLIQKLVDGDWDDDFLYVPVGHKIVPSNDANILKTEKI